MSRRSFKWVNKCYLTEKKKEKEEEKKKFVMKARLVIK